MKIMVAYDGTFQAKDALVYGMQKAREKGGEVVALHVFNSPAMIDYDASTDAEGVCRAEAGRFIAEAKTIIRDKGAGVKVSLFSTEGNPEAEVIAFAKAERADILLCPPKYKTIVKKYHKALTEADLVAGAEKLDVAALSVPTNTH